MKTGYHVVAIRKNGKLINYEIWFNNRRFIRYKHRVKRHEVYRWCKEYNSRFIIEV